MERECTNGGPYEIFENKQINAERNHINSYCRLITLILYRILLKMRKSKNKNRENACEPFDRQYDKNDIVKN